MFPRLPTGFHVSCGTLDPAGVLPISPTGLSPCLAALPNAFGYRNKLPYAVRTPGILLLPVWPLPRSLATTDGISVDFFSSPYLDVSVQAVPHMHLWIQCRLTEYCSAGFPHSEICGSTLICSSPQLIAACRVLLRLSVPRHSPCALYSLTSSGQSPFLPLPALPEAPCTPLPLLFRQNKFCRMGDAVCSGFAPRSYSCYRTRIKKISVVLANL